MKLRNLMYATMIACAFASCSNDDVPTPDNGNPDAQGGTSLTVKFDKAADTKASGDITSLSMLVFNADGKLEVVGTKVNTPAVEGGNDAVAHAELTAGVKEVALIANYTVPTNLIGETKEEVFTALNKTFDSELEVGAALTMNSKIYTGVVVAAEKKNVFGFTTEPTGYVNVEGLSDNDLKKPVKLYRNVAKVVLNKISAKVTTDENKPKYSDPQLDLKEIFILQGHKKTNLMGEDWKEYGSTNVENEWYSAYEHTTDWLNKVTTKKRNAERYSDRIELQGFQSCFRLFVKPSQSPLKPNQDAATLLVRNHARNGDKRTRITKQGVKD